jgi:hypothetical protein
MIKSVEYSLAFIDSDNYCVQRIDAQKSTKPLVLLACEMTKRFN